MRQIRNYKLLSFSLDYKEWQNTYLSSSHNYEILCEHLASVLHATSSNETPIQVENWPPCKYSLCIPSFQVHFKYVFITLLSIHTLSKILMIVFFYIVVENRDTNSSEAL